jgi:hypothetical protein
MARDASDPRAISQDLLDRTGKAYVMGDFDSFAACFLLPQHVATHDGTRYLETREDLRAMFDSMRAFFAERGATHLDRVNVAAEFTGADTISATHHSRLMAGDRVIQTAYPAHSILKRHDGAWKVAFSQYAVPDAAHSGAMGTLTDSHPIHGATE